MQRRLRPLAVLATASLSYCISKSMADWRDGYVWKVIWGAIAALSCLIFLGLLLAGLFVMSLNI